MPKTKNSRIKQKIFSTTQLIILFLCALFGLFIGFSTKFFVNDKTHFQTESSNSTNNKHPIQIQPAEKKKKKSETTAKTSERGNDYSKIKTVAKVKDETKPREAPKTSLKKSNLTKIDKKSIKNSVITNLIQKKIAIVVDDMGLNLKISERVVGLKPPLTLSYLPYAADLKRQTRKAKSVGHELLLHLPMEPIDRTIDPGPNVLLSGINKKELVQTIRWNLNQFDDFVGINNHMGSKFTLDTVLMTVLFTELKANNLFFLDSLTIKNSKGEKVAKNLGVPFLKRDIFIDHVDNDIAIKKKLREVERISISKGSVIAICHPRKRTLSQLKPWLHMLQSRGFKLVPVSHLLKKK